MESLQLQCSEVNNDEKWSSQNAKMEIDVDF